MRDYSEQVLVERPAIALFNALGWQTEDCFHETFGPNGSLGREARSEVVPLPRLRAALRRLRRQRNPARALPASALHQRRWRRSMSASDQRGQRGQH